MHGTHYNVSNLLNDFISLKTQKITNPLERITNLLFIYYYKFVIYFKIQTVAIIISIVLFLDIADFTLFEIYICIIQLEVFT